MKTICTSLPVYDKLEKQCFEKGKDGGMDQPVTIKCPRHRLPSMEWNVETDNPGEITDIDLIDKAGAVTDITDYFCKSGKYFYQMLTTSGAADYDVESFSAPPAWPEVLQAKKTTAAGEDRCGVLNREHNVAATAYILNYPYYVTRVDVNLVLASGTAPKAELRSGVTFTTTASNTVQLVNGRNVFFLTPSGVSGANLFLTFFNGDTETCDWSLTFNYINGIIAYHPRLYTALANDYFQYKEIQESTANYPTTLNTLLTAGIYYLKFTTLNGYVYYSDWFEVTCIYPNLITGWPAQAATTYETFTSSGTVITSAIETGAAGAANSINGFNVLLGEVIRVTFFHTQTSGQVPTLRLYDMAFGDASNLHTVTVGLNDVLLTSTRPTGTLYLVISNTAASNFATSEILVMRTYSEKYLTVNFHNTCDLGDILYADGLTQTIWFESETMEPSFPQEEEGVKNGEGLFVRSFARQTKKYLVRTKEMPAFMVEVFHRLKLHDTVELIDLVGDENTVYNLEVEHEWLWDDKYYAKLDLTFDYDETFVIAGCCNNIV